MRKRKRREIGKLGERRGWIHTQGGKKKDKVLTETMENDTREHRKKVKLK